MKPKRDFENSHQQTDFGLGGGVKILQTCFIFILFVHDRKNESSEIIADKPCGFLLCGIYFYAERKDIPILGAILDTYRA